MNLLPLLKEIVPWLNVALIGVISGVISAFVSPFLTWRLEREKLRHTNRKEFIATARAEVAKMDRSTFLGSEIYARLKPYLSEKTISDLHDHTTKIVAGKDGRSGRVIGFAEPVFRDLARLEKEWHLL